MSTKRMEGGGLERSVGCRQDCYEEERDGRDDFMEDMRECRPHGMVRDQDLT